ncbi:hypothetical protein [uncultured Photobacterium sp.]|uniref:hypothetical protein n=1 Tax=uncultured Photobacterium sp. TaxID=173973 RepID=UPI002603A6C3|nr:hypothetical protein [uncultured Photobacterium sp.]
MTARIPYNEGIQRVAKLTGRTFLCLLDTYKHIQRDVAPRQWVGTDELPRPELDRLYWRGVSSKIVVRCDKCGTHILSTVSKETFRERNRTELICNHPQTPAEIIMRIEETGLFKFERWVGQFNFAHSYALVYCQLCGGIQKKRLSIFMTGIRAAHGVAPGRVMMSSHAQNGLRTTRFLMSSAFRMDIKIKTAL